jgi:hypothetical protein
MPATSAGMTVERQSANQFVIPGRRASAGPGIQTQGTVLFLDSGFALLARPGITN